MRSVTLNEIIPGKLYQRGQFLTFPFQSKMDMLNRHNISMVVNLWSRPDPELHVKPGLVYLHWPIAGNAPPAMTHDYVEFINEHMKNGKVVLVHCEAGVNRSVWLVTRLVAKYEALFRDQALVQVTDKISRVKIREGLLKDLE